MGKIVQPINGEETKQKRICFRGYFPVEIHSVMKMHAGLKGQTLTEWITKAIVEQLGRENTLIRDKTF
jgi:hypothetical protein